MSIYLVVFLHICLVFVVFEIFTLGFPPKNSIFVVKTCENSSCVLLAPATKESTKNIEKAEREKTKKHVISSLKLGAPQKNYKVVS